MSGILVTEKISNGGANVDSNSTKPENEMSQEHEASFQVDSSLLRFIIGPGGVIKAKIENDCGVVLHIPSTSSSAKFAPNIIVRGPTVHDVIGAERQIQEVVEQAVKSTNYQYMHFISLPLAVHESVVKEHVSFEEDVLAAVRGLCANVSGHEDDVLDGQRKEEEEAEKAAGTLTQMLKHRGPGKEPDIGGTRQQQDDVLPCYAGCICAPRRRMSNSTGPLQPSPAGADMGIDESIFVKAKTFHLTVQMLKLRKQDRIDAGVDILQRTREAVLALEKRLLEIELKGSYRILPRLMYYMHGCKK